MFETLTAIMSAILAVTARTVNLQLGRQIMDSDLCFAPDTLSRTKQVSTFLCGLAR